MKRGSPDTLQPVPPAKVYIDEVEAFMGASSLIINRDRLTRRDLGHHVEQILALYEQGSDVATQASVQHLHRDSLRVSWTAIHAGQYLAGLYAIELAKELPHR